MQKKSRHNVYSPKRAKKQPNAKALNFQSMLIREARKLALLGCVCGLPVYIYVMTIPEQKKLKTLEARLQEVEKKEQLAIEANDRITREISAYRSNPEYLEIIARDHLNYYKEGETIIRIDR